MRTYELTFIVQPGVEDDGFPAVVEQVQEWIKAQGGEVLKTDLWGKRRLAYPIRKHREGYYALIQARIEPAALNELEHNLKLNEDILRYLLVRIDEKEE